MVDRFVIREAEASVALDGETQSEQPPNVYIVRAYANGDLVGTFAYHPDFPGVSLRERGQHVRRIPNTAKKTPNETE